MPTTPPRSPREVFESHLRLRREADLEEDLRRNYAHDIVLLCGLGVLRGHDALRENADRLHLQLPGARFSFDAKQVEGEYALLLWRAESDGFDVEDGADSFVIRDGRIVMQTVHYRLIEHHGGRHGRG